MDMLVLLRLVLAVLIFALMLGLGATIHWPDFKKTLKQPKGPIVGLVAQYLFMPLLAFCMALVFQVSDRVGLSMVIMGCCPGGTTSNIFSLWSRGDLGLSVAMTVISTVCALFMMPLTFLIYTPRFTSDDVEVDYVSIFVSLLIVLIPVSIGMCIRLKSAKWGYILEKVATITGLVFILLAIVFGMATNGFMFEAGWEIWLAGALLMPLGATFAYLFAWGLKTTVRQRRTIALEAGIQNASLAIAIVTLSFGDLDDEELEEFLYFPLIYGVMLVTGGLIISAVFRWAIPLPKEEAEAELRERNAAVAKRAALFDSETKEPDDLEAMELEMSNPTAVAADEDPASASEGPDAGTYDAPADTSVVVAEGPSEGGESVRPAAATADSAGEA